MLLTRVELDFLLERREFTKPQKRYIRYKLRKKVNEFLCSELPLLRQKGYIMDTISGVAASNYGVAAGSHDYTISATLVAQLAERGFVSNRQNGDENESPKWDLNPRPQPALFDGSFLRCSLLPN
jgi:hypothetical protein